MQAGKLPLELLSELLSKVEITDPRVALGPSPGEDAALIDFGDRYLVASRCSSASPNSPIHRAYGPPFSPSSWATSSGKSVRSPTETASGCAEIIWLTSVDPERGIPTTKTGLFERDPR